MAAPFNVRKGRGFTIQAIGMLIGILGMNAYAMETGALPLANLVDSTPTVPALGVSQGREPQLRLVLALAESRKESGQRVSEAQMPSSSWREGDASISPPVALLPKLSTPDATRLARLSTNKKHASKPASSGVRPSEAPPGKENSSTSDSASSINTPAPALSVTTWEIAPTDRTLNAALMRWAAAAGWQLVWELPVDYPVETRASISGTFDEAILAVAKSFEAAEVPIKAIFYDGNKVLRIVAKGSE